MAEQYLTEEGNREFGAAIAEVMGDYAKSANTLPDGFEVEDASLTFTLGDSAGIIAGRWVVTVVRVALE